MSNSSLILKLYKNLIREAGKFSNYNFRKKHYKTKSHLKYLIFYNLKREYSKEKIRYEFRQNKQFTDNEKRNQLIEKAKKNLDLIKRQVVISDLYPSGKIVIEKNGS